MAHFQCPPEADSASECRFSATSETCGDAIRSHHEAVACSTAVHHPGTFPRSICAKIADFHFSVRDSSSEQRLRGASLSHCVFRTVSLSASADSISSAFRTKKSIADITLPSFPDRIRYTVSDSAPTAASTRNAIHLLGTDSTALRYS